jgi:nucleotide-binding universal stress UspA family protein
MLRRILVPLDGSALAEQTLSYATELGVPVRSVSGSVAGKLIKEGHAPVALIRPMTSVNACAAIAVAAH